MATYNIRELENLSGIKAHTIRIWEKRFGLITPQRTSTNIRTYGDEDLRKLLNVSLLNRNGIKISTIAGFSDEQIIEKVNELNKDGSSSENQSEILTAAMVAYDENLFEQIIARSVIRNGFEETVLKIVYPFMRKIGLMWQTGSIIPAQEHFISNLVRQKIIAAIDGLVSPDPRHTPKMAFFLPEDELHEIGLLFFCYLAKKRGYSVFYLGQSLPLSYLYELVEAKNITGIVTSLTSTVNMTEPEEYLNTIARRFPEKILMAGGSCHIVTERLEKNVKIVFSPVDFIGQLNELSYSINAIPEFELKNS